jgi:hypothetical protein
MASMHCISLQLTHKLSVSLPAFLPACHLSLPAFTFLPASLPGFSLALA